MSPRRSVQKLVYALSLIIFAAASYITYRAYTFYPPPSQQVGSNASRHKIDKPINAEGHSALAKNRGHEDVSDLQNRIGALEKKLEQIETSFDEDVESTLSNIEKSLPALLEEKAIYQAQLADLETQTSELEERLALAQHDAPGQSEEKGDQPRSKELQKSTRNGGDTNALGKQSNLIRANQSVERRAHHDEGLKLKATHLESLSSLLQKEQAERHEKTEEARNVSTLGGIADFTKPSEEGEETFLVITLGSGLFRSGQTHVTPQLEQAIRDAAHQIEAHPDSVISVEGHTDNVPLRPAPKRGFSDNMGLSLWRATIVAAKLAEVGANPKKIKVVGYGESRPLASNETESGRAKNRRVEIRVLKPGKASPNPVTGD